MKNKKQDLTCIERYFPTLETGLSNTQVAKRIECGLCNTTKRRYSKSYLNIVTGNVCTFFNLLGLIVFISLLLTGAKPSNFFFVLFYIANISIGIIQELRAKVCIDKLSLLTSKMVKVIRNGEQKDIHSTEIVLDDILILGIGNQVPTDCKILQGDIEVNQAFLTGESIAIKMGPGDDLLAGSIITSGFCTVQAVKVGKENYVEQLSEKAKAYKKPQSEIMRALTIIIQTISSVILPIAIISILRSIILFNTPINDAVLGASTIVIGMIPAGMFLLTSVALAVGILKLAKHKTLVQDLYSLEMLARVDTICFDKTGTITDGNMTVTDIVHVSPSDVSVEKIISSMLYALKNNNQTAIALVNRFGEVNHYNTSKILHFNSTRKLSAVMFNELGTYAFGAPEFVLNSTEYNKVTDQITTYTQKGFRVLVLAHSNGELDEEKIPDDFTALSLLIIADNIREDVIPTIKWFKDNDVEIKVISGDNPITVSEVCKRVGIENTDKYISLDGLTDEQVQKVATEYTIFGRVTPEQKAILVKALKDAGHITAMTGDGVNDILALKEANCAISVASGTEAARNVSHLVLLDNNFNSLPKVVYEGRRVINNVQSSASLFLMKTLFTMVWAIITLCLPYMKTYPYNLSNMILFELFVVGIPTFFLSLQPNDARVSGDFISFVVKKAVPSAFLLILSVLIVEIFRMASQSFHSSVYDTMGVYALTFTGLVNLHNACRPLNKYRSVVFGFSAVMIIILSVFAITGSLENLLSLPALLPIEKHIWHIALVFLIVLLDIPLWNALQKLFKNVDLSRFIKK